MKQYVCTVCGYVYDEAAAPGITWVNLLSDWACPLCGAEKEQFEEKTEPKKPTGSASDESGTRSDGAEMSFAEMSALCSNLSKGCEKQYRPEESELFARLGAYYSEKSAPAEATDPTALNAMIEQDLNDGYPAANGSAARQKDRGALRALTWGEKVTRILQSVLSRYEKQGDALVDNTNVHVCEICGFVYIGDKPPEICPVCKVPNIKITQIDREAV